ncbi:MAG: tRNA (adenosine(37)-N6)-threonylcarbamoyltransferase complex dimerization subunit type 1 TsaB, partial [Veillonella sp.]|nr:tRNA (adenosine(37)-N6)-threonylcarbamoyltransferase complex dimerization subunit type 1 TsaB [Veillonella sp.]
MWLGIETSSVVSSVAVMNESQLLGEITIQAGLTHSEQLVPHIQSLLEMTRVEKSDLKGIVVASGPGSFT